MNQIPDEISRPTQQGKSRKSVTVYEVGLVSLCIYWFLHRTRALSRLTPRLVLGDIDYGVYLVAVIIFGAMWGILFFLERNLGTPRWVAGIRSHQGTSRYVDVCILVTCFIVFAVSLGSRFLDLNSQPFLIIVLLIAFFAAALSLFAGHESYRAPIEGAIEAPWQESDSDEQSEWEEAKTDEIAVTNDAIANNNATEGAI